MWWMPRLFIVSDLRAKHLSLHWPLVSAFDLYTRQKSYKLIRMVHPAMTSPPGLQTPSPMTTGDLTT